MRNFAAVVLTLLSLSAHAQTFRPEALHAHMNFLASDLLEGRGTGTRGYEIAAEYVAAQFAAAGLEPGADGGWLQQVPFRKTMPQRDSVITLHQGGSDRVLRFGEGFITSGNPLAESWKLDAPVVYAGFGVTAPELKYDDYAKIDAKGKVVAVFNGAPKQFSTTLRAHYSASTNKMQMAAAHGAVGVILMGTPQDFARVEWSRVVRQTSLGAMHWLRADGAPSGVFPEVGNYLSLSAAGCEALFTGSRQTYVQAAQAVEQGAATSFPLNTTVTYDIRSVHSTVSSPNVVGVLRGSDPALRDEYVVYTSHLDHLGISEPVDGDAINNGALDNASGIAAMIEMARAFGSRPHPRRSIVFVATTGEEKGLKGADYYANNPTVPVEDLVANINVDEILMFSPTRDITVIGAENSSLEQSSLRVAKAMGLELSPDPFPEEVVFVRSDQYPFVKRGIPAVFPIAGYKAVDPKVDLPKVLAAWDRERYHSPKDDMQQPMDLRAGVQVTEFAYRLGVDVANAAERPTWNKANFFGERFGRTRMAKQ